MTFAGPWTSVCSGIACVVSAVTLFILQDATIKWLSGTYPLHEVILVRASSAVAVTLFAMRLEGGFRLWRTRRVGLILARSTLLVIANSTFFLGLASMSIAEATSIFFIAPVLITALTALVLAGASGPSPLGRGVRRPRGRHRDTSSR